MINSGIVSNASTAANTASAAASVRNANTVSAAGTTLALKRGVQAAFNGMYISYQDDYCTAVRSRYLL